MAAADSIGDSRSHFSCEIVIFQSLVLDNLLCLSAYETPAGGCSLEGTAKLAGRSNEGKENNWSSMRNILEKLQS